MCVLATAEIASVERFNTPRKCSARVSASAPRTRLSFRGTAVTMSGSNTAAATAAAANDSLPANVSARRRTPSRPRRRGSSSSVASGQKKKKTVVYVPIKIGLYYITHGVINNFSFLFLFCHASRVPSPRRFTRSFIGSFDDIVERSRT